MTVTASLGCEPLPFVEAVGEGGAVARFIPAADQEVGGGVRELAARTGPVASLRYSAEPDTRVYLLRGDLNEGIDPLLGPIDTLAFPRTSGLADEREIALGSDRDWGSLRAYDMGDCSFTVPWRGRAGLENILNELVEELLAGQADWVGPITVGTPFGSAAVGPILRRDGNLPSRDYMRYNARIRAASVANLCGPVVVEFETRYATEIRPARATDSCTGEPVPLDADLVDLALVPVGIGVEVEDFCLIEDKSETGLNGALATAVSEQFNVFLDQVRVFENSTLGLPEEACSCDSDCQSGLSPRGRCLLTPGESDGVCAFTAEIDRIFLMPEGFVLVYAEDSSDFQHLFLRSREFEAAVFQGIGGLTPEIGRAFGLDYSCRDDRLPMVDPEETEPMAGLVQRVWNAPSL